MKESNITSGKSKWYGRLAWLFLILFSVFWSLGTFFFSVLLGFSALFAFFAFHYSDLKISLFDSASDQGNKSYTSPTGSPVQSEPALIVRRIIRVFIIIVGSFVLFTFVAGIFSSKDKNAPVQATDATDNETSAAGDNDDATSYTNKGIELFNNGLYDSALFYYDKVLAINPNDADGIYNKALAYFMKQDYRKSVGIVKKCLRLNPDYNTGWWLLGDDYYSMNQYDSALISLEKAYRNDYSDSGFLELLGDTYLKSDNRSKAKDIYLQVIQQDTTKADVYKQLAELDPDNANVYRARAAALERTPK